jgi:hypothetical protein
MREFKVAPIALVLQLKVRVLVGRDILRITKAAGLHAAQVGRPEAAHHQLAQHRVQVLQLLRQR